jgi:serine/threonine-protein kinase
LAVNPGTRLGPYEISALLGVGGMGEVYRATDSNLKRQVAIKVLPASVAGDADRLARFQREAEVLAALNHPNIAHLYGLEKSHGTVALVMELVEGPTLADRIAIGAIPIDEALPVARQIAEALEAAHEQGIIHRDLKPANIKVRPDGTAKVLDFGLAKALEPGGATSASLSISPTITSPAMTQLGMILGTAAYMAPEQARGKTVDRRADIWAYGAVVFEMLTGQTPFPGEDTSHVLARVIERDPDWTRLPASTPPTVRHLLTRCLTKDPKERLQAVGDARIEIGDLLSGRASETHDAALVQRQIDAALTAEREKADAALNAAQQRSEVALSAARRTMRWQRLLVLGTLAVLVTGAIVGLVAWRLRPASPPLPVTRFTIALGEGQQFTVLNAQKFSMSPDGAQIVYVANNQLYLRSMRDFEARAIPGTLETPTPGGPVFSPDGQSIAFYSQADRAIKRIAVSGGAAVTICPIPTPDAGFLGMSWSSGVLLFGHTTQGILWVSENGGQAQTLIAAKNQELLFGPRMLPGGEWVLFTSAKAATSDGWDQAQIFIQSVKSSERKQLISGGSDARYLPTGHLIYALRGVVFAVPFDLRHLTVTGGPVPVVEGVRRSSAGTYGTAQLVASNTGSLAFEPGPVSPAANQTDIAIIDRKTGATQTLHVPTGAYEHPRVSPDGTRIVFGSNDGVVWIYELSGASSARRLTVSGHDRFPVWIDAEHVAFQSDREGDLGIFWQRTDGTTLPERLTTPDLKDTAHIPESWSPIGKTLLFSISKKSPAYSLASLSLPEKKVTPFAGITSIFPISATFSPDGKWFAYTTAPPEATITALFVRPFPLTEASYPITTRGIHPFWSPDGKELIYSPRAGDLDSVSVTTKPSFTFGNPVSEAQRFVERGPRIERNNDILPNGRLLGTLAAGSATLAASPPQIDVVLNWFEELKARVPTK